LSRINLEDITVLQGNDWMEIYDDSKQELIYRGHDISIEDFLYLLTGKDKVQHCNNKEIDGPKYEKRFEDEDSISRY